MNSQTNTKYPDLPPNETETVSPQFGIIIFHPITVKKLNG
jgi:hypothetical protein